MLAALAGLSSLGCLLFSALLLRPCHPPDLVPSQPVSTIWRIKTQRVNVKFTPWQRSLLLTLSVVCRVAFRALIHPQALPGIGVPAPFAGNPDFLFPVSNLPLRRKTGQPAGSCSDAQLMGLAASLGYLNNFSVICRSHHASSALKHATGLTI
ncbi:hypothetical protein [Leisingera daeponensis]|uniref:hypothetical protein n=1 Tax=Leisingera daeponensis TaxID=405746 RepID=UPI001C976FDD|nr:hypothetical protein [Leisingera daeponensis]MBY6055954.1 hypothetical protein [Leisingera daeponensis]